MGNSLLSISMITKEAARILRNNLGFAGSVNRQYDDQFANSGAKIGSVINIRKPVRYTVSSGQALSLQDITDQSVALTLDTQNHVDFQFSSKDMELSVDDFAARYIKPAINALTNQIDYNGLSLVNNVVWNAVGTPGVAPATLLLALQARQKLMENACPMDDDLTVCLNPAAEASLVNGLSALFHSGDQIKQNFEKGYMGYAAGFKFKMDQNIQAHTVGALVGTPIAACATAQAGANIITNGWTGAITNCLLPGDVVTFANVYALNPVSLLSNGVLKQFVVTSAVSSNAGNFATVTVSPSISTSGPYATCNSNVVNSAAMLTFGAATTYSNVVTPNNVAFHKDAFVLGMADLPLPGGVDMASRASDKASGISLRVVRAYDIVNDIWPTRLDVLYGWKEVYPELACRIQG